MLYAVTSACNFFTTAIATFTRTLFLSLAPGPTVFYRAPMVDNGTSFLEDQKLCVDTVLRGHSVA